MKKTLLAVGVLAAFAGSAYADVTVYGRIDAGFQFTETKVGDADATDTFEMISGGLTSSRLGFKGSEDLGNGMTVGFVLENGYSTDSGKTTAGKLFDRQSTLSLAGDFGTIYAGRIASMNSDGGSMALFAGNASALGTGAGGVNGHSKLFVGNTGRRDNMLSYISPEFAGVTLYAQYGMGDSDENTSKADRYAALGAKFSVGALNIVGTIDQVNEASAQTVGSVTTVSEQDDAMSVNLAANYDFGVAKIYVSGQYGKDFNNVKYAGFDAITVNVEDIYNVNFGAKVPMGGGNLLLNLGYSKADVGVNGDEEVDGFTMGGRYEYALSKSTKVYTGLNYMQVNDTADVKTKVWGAVAGMAHYF